ncbi:MAG: hypothetical protein DRZ82_04890 [Thermoprotei archaeon]|nr:MAG: hypothetical protein DRZ82_04890 [Thermoprotei archaeon]
MGERAKKLILIGIDSLILDFVEKFISEGLMPNIKYLMNVGSYGYALPSMPTFTPPNWTTIATGADPAIHGVKGWVFDSRASKVEYLWTIAARKGKHVVLLRYPGGYPATHKNVITISNGAPHDPIGVLEEATAYTLGRIYRYTGGLHGTAESRAVAFRKASGWKNIPKSLIDPHIIPLEARVDLIVKEDFKQVKLWFLVYSEYGKGYDTLLISMDKDFIRALCKLRRGEWSDFIKMTFWKEDKAIEGVFKFKLVELAPDMSKFALFRTQIHALTGFSDPPNICEELVKNIGPFLDNPSRFCLAHGWYEVYFEELREHVKWIVKAARYLKEKYRWDLLFTHCQSPDYIKHEYWAYIDPIAPGYKKEKEEEYWKVMAEDYQIMDEFVGDLIELADEDTLIVVASDHGHFVRYRVVFLFDALRDAGFIVCKDDERIDVKKSIVRALVHDGIILNTKWRFKDGIISSKEDYIEYVNQIIDILLSITDDGRHVIYLAIPGWEAHALGLSEEDADIVLCPRPGYAIARRPSKGYSVYIRKYIGMPDPQYGLWGGATSIHEGLPTARVSIGTNMAMFIMSGPGVKKGFRCKRPIWLRDLAPTIAYLLDLPIPRGANGRILYEILS